MKVKFTSNGVSAWVVRLTEPAGYLVSQAADTGARLTFHAMAYQGELLAMGVDCAVEPAQLVQSYGLYVVVDVRLSRDVAPGAVDKARAFATAKAKALKAT